MEETKIWEVEGTSATPLNTTNQMDKERLLEDILTANPNMLEEGLQLVGRQTSTAGGPLDLLGVDNDGRLVVFELKRGKLNRDAIAQVIDYASYLNNLEAGSLVDHIQDQSGKHGIEKIDDFKNWYSKLRASNELPEEDLEALKPPRMVLVGLGVDYTTERMVNYMASSKMDISLLTFEGFVSAEGKTLLARNVEVDSEKTTPNRGARSPNRRAQFERRVVETLSQDMQNVLSEIERMFREQRSGFTKTYTTTRMNFSLDYKWHEASHLDRVATLFIELDEVNKGINVGFHPMAIHLASEGEFKNAGLEFEIGEPRALIRVGIDHEIRFPLHSLEEWDARREELTTLTQKVCEAYNAARENAQSESG